MAVSDDLEGVGRATGARSSEMEELMRRAIKDEVCPFCPERLEQDNGHLLLRQFGKLGEPRHWNVWFNRTPFAGTSHHLMLASVRHVLEFSELEADALLEFFQIIEQMKEEFRYVSYSLLSRLGDPRFNSATVYHLHAHVVVSHGEIARPGDLSDEMARHLHRIERFYLQLRASPPEGMDALEWIDLVREGLDVLRAQELGKAYPIRAKLSNKTGTNRNN